MCKFEVYWSKSGSVTNEGGLGAAVVKRLTTTFRGKNHCVYLDKFFSTVSLAKELLQHDIYRCGTARSNRKECPVCLRNEKLKRDEFKSKLTENSTIECIVWQVKKPVSFINTISDPHYQTQVTPSQTLTIKLK